MKIAKLAVMMVLLLPGVRAQQPGQSTTTHQLTVMLNQFLDDASHGNRAGFDRFFADDVIYTGSNALVRTKPEIMKNVGSMKPTPGKKTTYSAEDVTVHDFGDAAIVAFRLVARTETKNAQGPLVETESYRNTGTFLRRNGRWQVVAWQATKMPKAAAP
ncbi:MAG TPA: nuclear transport factor 2 family protein, partial [Candidatus Acidoferrales bacterium]|nr:nuclear transport factor 2 family protein [Candidatus Acidoferrales bacterium]